MKGEELRNLKQACPLQLCEADQTLSKCPPCVWKVGSEGIPNSVIARLPVIYETLNLN